MSILASKIFAIVYRFDIGAMLKSTIEYILEQFMLIIFYTDCKTLYYYMVKLSTIHKKCLMIDIICF